MLTLFLIPLLACSAIASPYIHLDSRNNDKAQVPNVVRSTWDGKCFYPTADETFHLHSYLGTWYQVAGTPAPYTAGCICTTAKYGLNSDGTISVLNSCRIQGRNIDISGTASPADAAYGSKGVLRVQSPQQQGPDCPGPNYIVQDYTPDFALVQSNNFSTLFVLSRQRNVADDVLDAWIARAGKLGSNLSNVQKINQTGCA